MTASFADLAATADSTLDTSAIDTIIGYRLRRAQASIFAEFKTHFDRLGLRPAEYSTLALIGDNPGRKPSELAEALDMQRANFVPLVNGLEQRDLIERRKSTSDRRSFTLYLTEKGQGFLADAHKVQAEFEAKCIAAIGGEKARDALLALLAEIEK